jgi:outer membrane biosynthesis protein TonB
MRAIALRPPVEIQIPPRPETPVIEPVQVEEQLEEPVLAFNEIELRDPGEGTREGEETGAGLPGGEGRGDQGNAMSGLRRLIPPTPRGVIMAPLNRPSNVRGKEVTVWVFINQAGAVDSVRLDPPTPDSRYNSDLMREARDWVFEPAERAGRAVATWYSYTWKL